MTDPILPRVVVVGCGALGSHVALFLRNEAHLVLVDGDKVEHKNVLSQYHTRSSVGLFKARALAAHLAFFGVKAEAVPRMLAEANVRALLKNAALTALVVDCTDDAVARTLMHDYAEDDVPLLHAALAVGDQGYGQVTWDSPSYSPDAGVGGAPTCHAGENLPMAALVAAYAARAAQDFLRHGRRVGYAVSKAGAVVL